MTQTPTATYSRFNKLLEYLRPHWLNVSFGIFALFIVNGLSAYLPLLISHTIDTLKVAFKLKDIQSDVLLILGLASLMWGIRMGSRILLFGVGRQVEFDLKQKIFEHLLRLEPAYFAVNTPGDLINRATSDVENIRRLVGFAVLSVANTLFAYLLTLPLMLAIDVKLSLYAIAVYPLIMLIVKFFSQRLRDQQLAVQTSLSNLSELIQEDMSGIALIKIYAQEANEQAAFAELNTDLLTQNVGLAKIQNTLFPFLGGVASISLLVLLALGTRAIPRGDITVGEFVALLLYLERLIFPTAILGFTITAYQRGVVSVDRIEAILQVKPAIADALPSAEIDFDIATMHGSLQARDLCYRYPGSETLALDHLNFAIAPGQMVAIVGPVGSGKSTLANALPRLLDIPAGQLFLDGYDLTQIPLSALRTAIAYVPQDSYLFSTTVKNNIRYGNPQSELEQVTAAAVQAQIHSEILNFPQQYSTLVGERGITLSGGQRQRTALARALLVDARILILDDSLASVDNQTATAILEKLTQGAQRKTVIFISHQMSAAAIADQILVMDHGKIVQAGTHRDLSQQPGLYQQLWNQQMLKAKL
jgi:ATP-binding cassette subfamily B protein